MNRRNYILGSGSLAAGSAAAVGTGAFSSVTANRDVTVTVANDSDAYLGLTPGDTGFVTEDDGILAIPLDGEVGTGDGINDEARFQIGNADESDLSADPADTFRGDWIVDDADPTSDFAFEITNQGTTAYDIDIHGVFGDTGFRAGYQSHVAIGMFNPNAENGQDEGAVASNGEVGVSANDVEPGESVFVSLLFDTTRPNVEVGTDDLTGTITISAE